MNAVRFTGTY